MKRRTAGLDNDGVKMNEAMNAALFPTTNYGQQTTIGTVADLRNPSLRAIRAYYYQYYVPNNMAVIMAGDFDPDVLIRKIDSAFCLYAAQAGGRDTSMRPERDLTAPMVGMIYGPSAESVRIGFRTPAADTRDAVVLDLISTIFSNEKAGLLDLNLNKQQKLQGAQAELEQFKDYGVLMFAGSPRQGQTLEQVRDLLLQQILLLKKGQFDDSLVRAIVANGKLGLLEGLQKNDARVGALMEGFILPPGYIVGPRCRAAR